MGVVGAGSLDLYLEGTRAATRATEVVMEDVAETETKEHRIDTE